MIHIDQLTKTYKRNADTVNALNGVSLIINAGEFVVVRGPSGCGKTTLLLAVGGMMHPTDGTVTVNGQDIYTLSAKERATFRAQNIGFVFQMFHLVPYLNTVENVMLANANGHQTDRSQVMELLEQLGIAERAKHLPSELSAGEKQRAAIARAMLNKPKLILADEPTGNLDPENAKAVIHFLADYQKQGGTVMFVTHGEAANDYATQTVQLNQGKLNL